MDRNIRYLINTYHRIVALRKESVDRNYIIKITVCRPAASLSARRAWIEIDNRRGMWWTGPCRSPQGERG